MNERGKLITLEGIEGSGKSTCLPLIRDWISEHGHACLTSREPGGTPLAEDIRNLLLTPGEETIAPESEFLLMAAARKQHLEGVIAPALQSGKWVVLDRFADSSVAYQGYGRGVDSGFINRVHAQLLGGITPDLTLWFDLGIATSRKRVGKRRPDNLPGFEADQHANWNTPGDRFETLGNDFFARVRQGYAALASKYPQRIRCINAEEDIPGVRGQVLAALKGRFTAE